MPIVRTTADAKRLRMLYEVRARALRELPPRELERFKGTLKHYDELIARYEALTNEATLQEEIGGLIEDYVTIPN